MKNLLKSVTLCLGILPIGLLNAATIIHAGNAFTGADDTLTGPMSIVIEGCKSSNCYTEGFDRYWKVGIYAYVSSTGVETL